MGYVIGLDAGGTRTRAVVADLRGAFVAGYDEPGGGNPGHDREAAAHVGAALRSVLVRADVRPNQIDAVVAGLAGLDSGQDQEWATAYVDLPELSCPVAALNDAVVAQAGAFAGGPGIVVVAGTGSMILGRTESGELVNNGRYPHYAGGARHLAFDLVDRLLIGDHGPDDEPFVREVLDYWEAKDLDHLRRRILDLSDLDRHVVKRRYGGLAPMITANADAAPVAGRSVDWLVGATAVGVRLVAGHFGTDDVPVASAGALACSGSFSDRLRRRLDEDTAGRCQWRPQRLDPVRGAVLMALRTVGVQIEDRLVARLASPVDHR